MAFDFNFGDINLSEKIGDKIGAFLKRYFLLILLLLAIIGLIFFYFENKSIKDDVRKLSKDVQTFQMEMAMKDSLYQAEIKQYQQLNTDLQKQLDNIKTGKGADPVLNDRMEASRQDIVNIQSKISAKNSVIKRLSSTIEQYVQELQEERAKNKKLEGEKEDLVEQAKEDKKAYNNLLSKYENLVDMNSSSEKTYVAEKQDYENQISRLSSDNQELSSLKPKPINISNVKIKTYKNGWIDADVKLETNGNPSKIREVRVTFDIDRELEGIDGIVVKLLNNNQLIGKYSVDNSNVNNGTVATSIVIAKKQLEGGTLRIEISGNVGQQLGYKEIIIE